MCILGVCYLLFLNFSHHCRPLSSPHDLMQLSGRGGRGPNIFKSSLEIIWNKSDLSLNVPGRLRLNKRVCYSVPFKFTLKINVNLFSPVVSLVIFDITGMSDDVRRVLDSEGCIPEKLSSVFGYKFSKKDSNCCSNCDEKLT